MCLFYVCSLGCWNKICMCIYVSISAQLMTIDRRGKERKMIGGGITSMLWANFHEIWRNKQYGLKRSFCHHLSSVYWLTFFLNIPLLCRCIGYTCEHYKTPVESIEISFVVFVGGVDSHGYKEPCIVRVKWRHIIIYGHDTIAILWVWLGTIQRPTV